MTPDRWHKIKEILQTALERNAGERAEYLDAACAGDPTLRSEVEELLDAHDRAGDFLETPALEHLLEFGKEAPDLFAGKHVGPYRMERLIGRGGMGLVYLAVRDDQEFRKRVAVKVVKRGMDTDEILRRFRHERQTLAALEHPNIARLLDGGTTDDGLPYFVMEYIEGMAIDEYCDVHRLSIVERLMLFRKVCSAVHYAHQNLVVHRDLKPGNILVTPDGEPKLLDFGIAKLINPEISGQSIELTGDRMRLMTPEFASPEQIRGEPITTASDVYSLGVLLYNLLTGHRPYRFKSRSPDEIQRVVCEQDPEKPSTAVTRVVEVDSPDGTTTTLTPESVSRTREGQPEKLRRRLAGDLDNIVLMAMRKEPQRRYASVQQFSDDIRRHLVGLPVIARKDTFAYRSAKFIRRHRTSVIAAALFVLLLISGIVGISRQARIAAEQRDRARLEAAKAEQVVAFLKEMLSAVDPYKSGKSVTVAEVLAEAARRLDQELGDHPEIEAEVRTTIGVTYQNLGLYDEAEPHLRRALAIREELYGKDHPDVAESLRNLAVILRRKGEFSQAEPLYVDAIAIYRKLKAEATREYAKALNDYALFLDQQEKYDEAEELLRSSLELHRQLLGRHHKEVLTVVNNLASVLFHKGDLDSAEPLYREALKIATENDDPAVYTYMNNLATVLQARKNYAAADTFFRKSLEEQRQLLGEEHPYIAQVLLNLAANEYHRQNFEEALRLAREAVGLFARSLAEDHPDVAYALWWQGRILNAAGQAERAEAPLRRSLQLSRKSFPEDYWLVAYAEIELGKSLAAKRRYAEAEAFLLRSYSVVRAAPGDNRSAIQRVLRYLTELYDSWGKPARAAQFDSVRVSLSEGR
jgi:serine/threonine-protein kinase